MGELIGKAFLVIDSQEKQEAFDQWATELAFKDLPKQKKQGKHDAQGAQGEQDQVQGEQVVSH